MYGEVAEAFLPTPDSKKGKGNEHFEGLVKLSSRKIASISILTNSTEESASYHNSARTDYYYFVRQAMNLQVAFLGHHLQDLFFLA